MTESTIPTSIREDQPLLNPAKKSQPQESFQTHFPSRGKSLFLVTCSILFPFLCSGLIFGFAALKPILLKSGVYKDLCPPNVESCERQKLRLDLMFTLSAAVTNACALPIGTILDRLGPRFTLCIGTIFFGLGCILFGTASSSLDLYIPGFVALAVGGPFIFISLLHLCNLFPLYSGLIMGLATGAFDASSSIFAFFAFLYNHYDLPLPEMFLPYSLVALLVFVISILVMPDFQYPSSSHLDIHASSSSSPAVISPTFCHSIQEKCMKSQLCRKEFWLLAGFMSLYMLRLNFYIATVQDQIEEFNPAVSYQMSEFFSVILPLGGVFSVPLIGYYLDRRGIIQSWYALSFMGALFGILSLIPSASLQYLSMVLFSILRPFLYTAGSFYVGHMFGYTNFGKIYGIMVFLTAIVNTSQYVLDTLVKYSFHNSFLVVNLLLTLLSFPVLYFPYYLNSKKLKLISNYSAMS
eukprot:Sdes_comp21171_c0_seq1m19838